MNKPIICPKCNKQNLECVDVTFDEAYSMKSAMECLSCNHEFVITRKGTKVDMKDKPIC